MSNLDLIRGRQVVEYLTNQSGGSVAAGDVVYLDTGHDEAFITGTTGAYTGAVGVAFESIASAALGRVIVAGYCPLVNVNASVTRGNYGKTHTVAKQATDAGSTRIAGTFCQWLTGGTTPSAHLFNVPDLGAAATSTLGTLGYAEITADSNTFTNSPTDITGLSATVTVGSGRRIKITAAGGAFGSTSATDTMFLYIREGSTILQQVNIGAIGSAQKTPPPAIVVLTPTAGSHTYKASCEDDGGGTGTWHAASQKASILVEDIGT